MSLNKESNLINHYVSGIYNTIDTRNIASKTPYMKYKITSTAINMFKRYYLKVSIIKTYTSEQFPPIQISKYIEYKKL